MVAVGSSRCATLALQHTLNLRIKHKLNIFTFGFAITVHVQTETQAFPSFGMILCRTGSLAFHLLLPLKIDNLDAASNAVR